MSSLAQAGVSLEMYLPYLVPYSPLLHQALPLFLKKPLLYLIRLFFNFCEASEPVSVMSKASHQPVINVSSY